jgi:hypothetical protein
MSPELHRYGTLADRPFLLSILQEWSCAVIRRPVLAWYRAHDDERRHQGMTADHVLNLFARYRREFPERWSADDETLFYQYSGFWLMRLYQLTPSAQRPALPEFLFRAMSAGLYNLRFAKRYGRKRLLTDLLFAR